MSDDDKNDRSKSERAREVERARTAHSEERVKAAESDTKAKLDNALRNFVDTIDLPDEDSKVQDLRKLAAERGIDWPPKARSVEPQSAESIGRANTQPSAEHPRMKEYTPDWRSPVAASIGAPASAPKILVIDDDRDTVETLVSILHERGYRVWRAYDGFDAVIRLQEMPECDLILLDVQMPRIDGREFLRYFDKSPHAHVPVVILSGGRKPIGEFDDRFVFLGKPLDVESLLNTVEHAIQAGKGRA